MTSQLYTYSLIRTLYDQKGDYIDTFWPLIVKALPTDGSGVSLDGLQNSIAEKYGLSIPQHSLRTITTRATRKGYTERRDKLISLTRQGIDFYYDKLEPERQAMRRVNELLEDARVQISARHQLSLTTEQIKDAIQSFVVSNLEVFEQFFNADIISSEPKTEMSGATESALLDYFMDIERTKPNVFRTLQDIICGSIISAIVHSGEMLVETGKRFERTTVYLDSNYLLSLLRLGYEEDNHPALELFRLMKAEGAFEFRVFDFTVHEITSLLKNYEREQHVYHPQIKVNSLFASLKTKGWTAAKVREFVVNFETQLWDELEVKIASTEVNLRNYEPADPSRRDSLAAYKPYQGDREQNHDLAAIDQIRSIRKKHVTRIEKCQAMLLTSDLKLALYNYNEEGHKDDYTISEVIPDRLLTNILWLKNPGANGKLSLDSIIAAHSRQLFVDQAIWKKFYKTVADLRSEGSIDDKDVSLLLFDSHIQEVLREYEPEDVDRVETDLMKIIEDYEKRRDDSSRRAVAVVASPAVAPPAVASPAVAVVPPAPAPEVPARVLQAITELNNKVNTLTEENNRIKLNTIDHWKKLQEAQAETETKLWIAASAGGSLVALLALSIYVVKPILTHWSQIDPIFSMAPVFLSLVAALLGVKLDPLHWRSRLKDKIFNRVYRRKLKTLEAMQLNFALDTPDET
jgi:hypothetical protein